MEVGIFRFEFDPSVRLAEAEMSLHLALYAAEGLFGEARVRLDASYTMDEAGRSITVDGISEVGAAVIKVFTGLLTREFGEHSFQVQRVARAAKSQEPTSISP